MYNHLLLKEGISNDAKLLYKIQIIAGNLLLETKTLKYNFFHTLLSLDI